MQKTGTNQKLKGINPVRRCKQALDAR